MDVAIKHNSDRAPCPCRVIGWALGGKETHHLLLRLGTQKKGFTMHVNTFHWAHGLTKGLKGLKIGYDLPKKNAKNGHISDEIELQDLLHRALCIFHRNSEGIYTKYSR